MRGEVQYLTLPLYVAEVRTFTPIGSSVRKSPFASCPPMILVRDEIYWTSNVNPVTNYDCIVHTKIPNHFTGGSLV